MSIEWTKLILRVVETGATWTTWLALLALRVGAGKIMLRREQVRSQTYREIRETIRPVPYHSDQTQRRSKPTAVGLQEPAPSRVHIPQQLVESKRT